ncbi:TNT domain-containing protein [Streptomyces barringtoniae]|uniref:TNT domain-containing protein n=1 Tax=Streptomyces barringtoniae TaxID=2892029 RepID=UPI001E5133E9|nr:TNT domain-containing protein [Streptomyces barringtoniae]MCC5474877.1 TNT domain-containing protein [Streptomyces barringtoniae]
MRVPRAFVRSALASLLLLIGTSPATAHADHPRAGNKAPCPTTHRTRVPGFEPPKQYTPYYRNDWRLGPKSLPRTGPLGKMLKGYQRTDHTSANRFLACYWQTGTATEKPGWWFPDNDGFVLKNGKPVEHPVTLRKGQLVDLFGSGLGSFLAPAGTPYAKRAIPPSNLDQYVEYCPFSYHLYRVVKPFTVDAGPIRPWFGQPGLGLQYKTREKIPQLATEHKLEEIPT